MATVPKLSFGDNPITCSNTWASCVQYLENLGSQTGIYCEPFIEDAFLRATPPPVDADWVGFSHLTFDETFSNFNLTTLFNDQVFLQRLPYCRGVFVFSNFLQQKWKSELSKLQIFIPVETLLHPVGSLWGLSATTRFTMSKFMTNQKRKVIQIGSWQRHWLSILRLGGRKASIPLAEAVSVKRAVLSRKSVSDFAEGLQSVIQSAAGKIDDSTEKSFLLDVLRSVQDDFHEIEFLQDVN